VQKAIELYEKQLARDRNQLAKLVADPEKRALYSEMMSAIASHAAKQLSPEELSARGRAGGQARKESTTPEQREAQARKAAQARWGTKKKK
jgi:hypothetical protein